MSRIILEGDHIGFDHRTQVDTGFPVIAGRQPFVQMLDDLAGPDAMKAFPVALPTQGGMKVIAERHWRTPKAGRSSQVYLETGPGSARPVLPHAHEARKSRHAAVRQFLIPERDDAADRRRGAALGVGKARPHGELDAPGHLDQ